MFLLCNIHDRNYRSIYKNIADVIFDLSDTQLHNRRNQAWKLIQPSAIVCVVDSSRKISTFCQVTNEFATTVRDDHGGYQHVIVGNIVAKLVPEHDMTALLNTYGVAHPHLPSNKFCPGFNVADLGAKLDTLKVQTVTGIRTVGQLGLPST